MADVETAERMMRLYADEPPRIGKRTLTVRYSNYDRLKMDNTPQVNASLIYLTNSRHDAQASLQVLRQMPLPSWSPINFCHLRCVATMTMTG